MSDKLADIIARIEAIAVRMEQEGTSLEDSIEDFEEGIALTRKAQALLESAEQRVRVLMEGDGEAAEPQE